MSGLTLTPEQAETVGLALQDAVDYRLAILSACADCTAAETEGQRAGRPVASCEAHREDDRLAERYGDLGEALFGGDES